MCNKNVNLNKNINIKFI